MNIKKVRMELPAKSRGNCEGCDFYKPNKITYRFGVGFVSKRSRNCINGSFDAPERMFYG
jgi:hypothetical protein